MNASGVDGDVNVWSVETSDCVHTCTLDRGGSFLLASSMDGRFLASVASEDPRDGRWR
jgi:WD40 repeat protein